jgi:hypothetical protein
MRNGDHCRDVCKVRAAKFKNNAMSLEFGPTKILGMDIYFPEGKRPFPVKFIAQVFSTHRV